MELELRRQTVPSFETILEETVEQSVECDALLPDYCPDIRRILKCTLTPVPVGKTITAGRLEVEGLATLNILYISAGGEPARGEYKVPFTRMLELHGEAEDPIITVGMLPGPVSCRAVNQRRLEIRGSVVVLASVISCQGQQILASSEEKTIQLRMAQQKGIRLSGAFDREQRLAKTTTLEGSAAPLTRVLRCDAAVSRREEKWLDGRLLITGEVLAAAHCADQNGGWQTAECTLPFELTIDCPEGADAEFDIRCRALAPTAEPMQDADGEYRALEWGVTISVEGKIYRAYALDCCTDGYSTRYQSACKGRTLQTVELVNLCRESETRRETLPLPEATGEVVALWARVEGCTAAPEGDGLLAEGRLGLTLLTKMGDGEYYSFDRTMELQRQLPGGEDCRWEAGLECRGCRWEQTGNELSLTCELVWQGAICRTRRLAVLEDITVDEAAPKENRMPRGLYIYMAEEGESLNAENLCKLYYELNQKYFGEDMVSDPQIAYEWARIPHFYYNFYVYQYATSFSAAVAIAHGILEEGAPAVERYKKFLSGGCSMSPVDLLKQVGINMEEPKPIQDALDVFGKVLDEIETLI